MNTPAPFFWGQNGQQVDPARKRVEDALMRNAMDFSPVGSPLEGMARVANAAASAYQQKGAAFPSMPAGGRMTLPSAVGNLFTGRRNGGLY